MKKIIIPWLTCDECGSNKIEVKTQHGDEGWLYENDEALCKDCKSKGTVETEDGCAWVNWEDK